MNTERLLEIEDVSPESVREPRESLRQEWTQLQILGRALTEEEQLRSQELEKVSTALESFPEFLEGGHGKITPVSPSPEPPAALSNLNNLIDGRYEGGNHEVFLEIRVDEEVSGVISADIYRNGITGRSYVASIRTAPGLHVKRNTGQRQILGTDHSDQTSTGILKLDAQDSLGKSITGTFPFAEPGEYEVQALLIFYDQETDQELVFQSNTLPIRIRFPQNGQEEDDAQVLLSEQAGLFFALGGSAALDETRKAKEAIRRRRQGKIKSVTDPVVANIVRCQGVDAGRSYTRFIDGKFSQVKAKPKGSADLLNTLSKSLLNKVFDSHTAQHTQILTKKRRNEVYG